MTRSRDPGLSLIDLILSISLTSLLAIPVGMLLGSHLEAGLRARDVTVAMNLARHEMERLDSYNDFCHADLALTAAAPPPLPGYWTGFPYDLTRIVQCHAGNCDPTCALMPPPNSANGIKRIELRVTKSGSGDQAASLVTYRTKFVRFGS